MLRQSDIIASIRYYYKKVKNFLSKAQSKELLTFLFFLFLAFLFWVLQSMNEEGEANFAIPVTYKNIPEQVVITNTPPDRINIKLRDKGIILMNYTFANRFVPIEIDIRHYMNKKGVIHLQDEQILAMLRKQLNGGSSVLSVSPDTITVIYSEQKAKRVPVVFNGDLSAASQSQIGNPIRLIPDSVSVYAPPTMLDAIHRIETQRLDLSGLKDTTTMNLSLRQEYGSKVVPPMVQVVIPVEEYTEKIMDIPLEVIGVPDSLTLRTFPTSVQLSCFVGLNAFKEIYPELFEVAIDFNELMDSPGNKVAVRIMRKPENVTNVRVKPDSVEYILEEKEVHD